MTHPSFGPYTVVQALGSGGMADVYLARDPRLDRLVAVKAPHAELLNAESRARFVREAKAAAALEHFAIVPIYDYSEAGDLPYMVMRYLNGGSLGDRVARKACSPTEALPVIERIAAALDYAHSRGVIHRDVKSANILFDEHGAAYLSDFGIAWLASAGETNRLTSTGMVRGTFDYISPEQAQGMRTLDGRSDLYSLGVVLFEMLTGDVPYQADSAVSLAVQHISAPVPDIRTRRPDLPAAMQNVINRALAKRPEDRYPSGAALADDLRLVAGGQPPMGGVAARRPSPPPRPRPIPHTPAPATGQPGTSRNLVWLLAAAGLIAVVALFIFTRPDPNEETAGSANVPAAPAGGRAADSPTEEPESADPPTEEPESAVIAVEPTSTTAAVAREESAAGASVAAEKTAPVAAVGPDEIVFQSNRDGDYEIYIMDLDGGNQRQLTFNGVEDELPRVSPDGRRIAFVSERDGNPEIYVMNRDGSEQTRLTNHSASDSTPNWSPDGRQIVFMSRRDGGEPDLYIMNADGGDVRRVTDTAAFEGRTSWSPDGARLAFNAYPTRSSTSWQLYVSNADGTDIRRITNSDIDELSPEWSPDGERILFISERDSRGNPGIYIMRPDGSDAQLLYNSPSEDWGASWSTDGRHILFATVRPDDDINEIMIMDADGRNVRRLTERGSFPSWAVGGSGTASEPGQTRGGSIAPVSGPIPLSGNGLLQLTFADAAHSSNYTALFAPDQSYILLSVEMGDTWQVWEADPSGGGLRRQITRGPYHYYQADLSPDGRTFLTSVNLDGDGDIHLLDVETGQALQQMTNDYPIDYHPRWLPGGSSFIYSTDDDGTDNDEIFLMTLDGRKTQLTDNDSFDGFATPSRDGRYVAFYSGRDGDYEIYVMDIDGRNQRRLTTSPGRDASPSFSPDGRWVVFESERGGRYEIYAMPFEGGETYRITDAPGDTYFPIISPDGQWLMFQSTRDGEMDIYRQPWELP